MVVVDGMVSSSTIRDFHKNSFDARAAPWHKVARHSERGGAVTDRGLKDGSRGRGEK